MKATLSSTTKIVMVNIDGARLPVRVWQGTRTPASSNATFRSTLHRRPMCAPGR